MHSDWPVSRHRRRGVEWANCSIIGILSSSSHEHCTRWWSQVEIQIKTEVFAHFTPLKLSSIVHKWVTGYFSDISLRTTGCRSRLKGENVDAIMDSLPLSEQQRLVVDNIRREQSIALEMVESFKVSLFILPEYQL